ncbi:methionyl-tRNA formyltransferase [Kineococcus gynurae]|uniref:Methionyl-tRNA formyltransferase n=1 Tax=Kineococcus gynurae TaxID=452979 RepID=A0ABV5LQJ8_9ACTN
MRLVVAGTPEVAVPALRTLLDSTHEVVAVLTRPDAQSGRGRRVVPSPMAALARDAGIELLQPERPRDPEFLDRLRELAPDACPVVAYGALVPRAALDVPRFGWLNLHFSLLPAWRGAAPVQRALMNGDEVTGACVFSLEEGLDTGPVHGRFTTPVGSEETAGELLDRLAASGAELLRDVLDRVEAGESRPVPQPSDGISLAPKIDVAEARVDWTGTADVVHRRVRGCTPDPGAWTTFRDARLKVGRLARPADAPDGLLPGRLRVERRRVLVGTGTHPLELVSVQPAGKKAMAATDWARGVRPDGEELR